MEKIRSISDTLVDAGVLKAEHCRGLNTDHFDLKDAVRHAMMEYTVQPKFRSPLCEIGLALCEELDLGSYNHESKDEPIMRRFGAKKDEIISGFQIDTDTALRWYIGRPLEDLYAFNPDLGRRVLAIICEQSWSNIRCFAPPDAYNWAQGFYWLGEVDETMVLDERRDEYRDQKKPDGTPWSDADILKDCGILTKKGIDQSIPPWAATKYNHGRSLKAFPGWEKFSEGRPHGGLDQQLWNIVKLAREVETSPKVWPRMWDNPLRHFEMTTYETACMVLGWHKRDCCQQIVDGQLEEWINHGDIAYYTMAVFPFFAGRPESIRWALQKLRLSCEAFAKFQHLVKALEDYQVRHPRVHKPEPPKRRRLKKGKALMDVLVPERVRATIQT